MTFVYKSLRTINMPITRSRTRLFSWLKQICLEHPVLYCQNLQLIKNIHVVKEIRAEKKREFRRRTLKKDTQNKLALVHDDRRDTGDDCEGKDWDWFLWAVLSNIWCQEMGIVCVPSWISMRQKGGDVVDAAWQNPPLRGEESIGSEAMGGCHVRKRVWYRTIKSGGIACCQMLSAVSVLCEWVDHTSKERSIV